MDKLLVICGPTGAGKTALGLYLAKKFKGDILSADSRQVYKGMDIMTGKDLPRESRFKVLDSSIGYWETPDGIRIWLTDMVDANEEFSVAQWNRAAKLVLKKLWQEERLPIVVGGTGLYIKALVDGIETVDIPPNRALRAGLSGKTADELYDILAQLDSIRAASMNQSDKKNPRRLLRAIELVSAGKATKKKDTEGTGSLDALIVGLIAPWEILRRKSADRVEVRYGKEGLDEVRDLLKQGVAWTDQSMTGIGYKRLERFFKQEGSLEEAKRALLIADMQYAKRQLVWFKRDTRIHWFDISEPLLRPKVEKLVGNWYTRA